MSLSLSASPAEKSRSQPQEKVLGQKKILAFAGLAGVRHSGKPWGVQAGWGQCPYSRVSVILPQGRLLSGPAPDRDVHLPSLAAQLFSGTICKLK